MSLRSRLILSHIAPLLLIVPLIGVALLYLLETQILLQTLSQNLTRQAILIAAAANGRSDIWANPERANAFLKQLDGQLDLRITLLAPSGAALAAPATDPDHSPPDLSLLADGRPQTTLTYRLDEQSATIYLPVFGVDDQLLGIIQVSDELESIASSFSPLGRFILLVLGGGLLVGALIGLLLALRLERPIGAVATAVADIASGQRSDPIPESGTRETKQLARSVNLLATRLREVELMRQRLLANLVHELGRPLGALKAAVNVLREGAGDDPALREEFLAGMDGTISRMEPLLDDLARLHGQILGDLRLDRRETDLLAWLPSLLPPWRAAAGEKGLDWRVDFPADLSSVMVDPDRLGQAVGNLLSNAVKYTPAGGAICLTAGETVGEIWLRVADTGPGIAPEEQTRIFEPFYRSQRERRFPQGLGLGLTIAAESVAGHNGRLTLDSTPGQGSAFTIHLPKEPQE